MANDVKNALHHWCVKHKKPQPTYEYDEVYAWKPNGTKSNQPTLFKCTLSVKDVKEIGFGEAKAKKMSATEACRDLVSKLIKAKIMPPKWVENVPNGADLIAGGPKVVELSVEEELERAKFENHRASVLGNDTSLHKLKSAYKNVWTSKETQIGNEVVNKAQDTYIAQTSIEIASNMASTSTSSDLMSSTVTSLVSKIGDKRPRSQQFVQLSGAESEIFYGRKKQKLSVEDLNGDLNNSEDDIQIVAENTTDILGDTILMTTSNSNVYKQPTTKNTSDISYNRFVEQISQKYPDELRIMSEQIQAHYERNKQDEKIFANKMEVRSKLLTMFRDAFNGSEVHLFAVGSSVNGMGAYNSDMDLCLVVPDPYLGTSTTKNYAMDVLRYSQKVLRGWHRQHGRQAKPLARAVQLIPAVVPILKVDLNSPYENIELDINCNNIAGVYNSHLLHYYAQVDSRFPALCLLIKHWAIVSDINDAMMGTFNSYSLILLALHYLQCAVTPPVLPNLTKAFPGLFDGTLPFHKLSLFDPLGPIPDLQQRNTQTLAELLGGFFAYYDREFDFKTQAISVKDGNSFSRASLGRDTEKYEVYIEEPFDQNNTARCIQKQGQMAFIKAEFRKAAEVFVNGPSLESLGVSL